YTAVDKAEDEREICNAINVNAVKIIADFCKKIDAKLIHYSTDYVFDGSGELPFTEENSENLNPINYYGETKLNSEKEIINSGCKYFIFRISWVYNHSGKNFPFTILKLASERDELKIVADQVGSPCYSMDIAKATLKIIENKSSDFGIYHLTPEEYISWFEFAKIIVEKARKYSKPLKVKGILPIKTSEFPVRAKRPLNSRLDSSKALKILGIKLPKIENSLEEFFKKI
ncbi:MAG: dTDP-4-dehydrorhamnose reductase, partial [Rickettsiales bacterium]|nr:dTDP-4-dehydrorhamnose reductase [Rickettsiales bacterium]